MTTQPLSQFDAVPSTLRARSQWVLHTSDKRPQKADFKTPASVSSPITWTTYERILAAWIQHRHTEAGLGIGFVLTAEDPFVVVDIDHCREPITGDIADWAWDIITDLATYTEISPSG